MTAIAEKTVMATTGMTAVSHDIASLESLKVVMPEHLHEPEMLEASPPNHSG